MTHPAFEHKYRRHVPALYLDFDAYVHRKTGAQHFHFSCEDQNNAFMVAFPTFPTDSTGVAHILEHTALCGSRRYPVRDPFFMMLRRSLNTFMNAFTSGDNTAYPFATQNRKDFSNLLAVYLDAVFFPILDPRDFSQEGWRLDFVSPDSESELIFKGVVYNEMKGAMSAPSMQVWQRMQSAIFPNTVYHFNSGGAPESIPDLSLQQLRDFHAKHYHPSHAIFMTYGNFVVDEHHEQFESLALCEFTRRPKQSHCALQPRFTSPIVVEDSYAVRDSSALERGTHVAWAWLLGRSADVDTFLEAHLINTLLLDHGASPLRHYLETTDLADAPSELCGVDDSGQELVFCCGVEGTDVQHIGQLQEEILELLYELSSQVFDHQILVGVLDSMEIAQRDFGGGGYPYGLQLMGRALPGSLYDGDPVAFIDIECALERLRRRIEEPSYIGGCISDLLLNNPHRVRVTLRPDEHKFERDNDMERTVLAERLTQMSEDQRRAIRAASAALEKRQDESQDADLLPKVNLTDVPRYLPEVNATQVEIADSIAYQYCVATNGLLYLQLVVELPALDDLELAQLPLFCEYLTELGSGSEDYFRTQARRALVGNIGAYAVASTSVDKIDLLNGRLVITVKGLERKRDDMAQNLFDVIKNVRFDESDRLENILAHVRVDAESSIPDRGHYIAMQGAARVLSPGARLDDLWEGPSYIRYVQDLARSCRDSPSAIKTLARGCDRIRNKLLSAPWSVLVVAEEGAANKAVKSLQTSARMMSRNCRSQPFRVRQPEPDIDCAWVTNTQVNFCAKAYPAVAEGHRDAAGLSVLAKFLQDGFLHPVIREKGGAYGAGAQYDPDSATFRFFSYRDPRLADTLSDFDRSLDWLGTSNDSRRLEESILGVIRHLDVARTPADTAINAFYDNADGRTQEFRLRYREAVLTMTFEEINIIAQKYLHPHPGCTAVVTNASNEGEVDRLNLRQVKF
tara:strand:+ start:3985 stop:6891 length:2907 start_codon:yes stop_codon:yes gene_type:complete